jgi:hypothetical protein
LAENIHASESNLFIYIDGPRTIEDYEWVDKVQEVAESVQGFYSNTVVRRNENCGLSRNIIDGVTEVVKKYGKVIVLEDDIVSSPHFLQYMNEALERYINEEKVWHIGGWNYPIDNTGLPETFFWRVMNCWGWGTWWDRWECFDKDPDRLITTWNHADIKRFNIDGAHDFWSQVLGNHSGKIDTWAIFWYATIFENRGLCLNPTKSIIKNIGHDGSGVHCGKKAPELQDTIRLFPVRSFPEKIEENNQIVDKIKKYMFGKRRSLPFRVIKRLKRMVS